MCGSIGYGEIGKPKKSMIKIVELGFQCFREKLNRDGGEAGKIYSWSAVVSMFEIDQN